TPYIYCCHQYLLNLLGHTSLHHHRFSAPPCALQQGKILHIAGTDLDDIGVLLNQFERFVINSLRNDLHAESIAHLGHNLQSLFAEPLKRARRSATLVCSPADELCSAPAHAPGGCKRLVMASHRAGPADERAPRPAT